MPYNILYSAQKLELQHHLNVRPVHKNPANFYYTYIYPILESPLQRRYYAFWCGLILDVLIHKLELFF